MVIPGNALIHGQIDETKTGDHHVNQHFLLMIERLAGTLMRSFPVALALFGLLAVVSVASAATPERSKGISMHMLPKRVANVGAKTWGLVVSYAEYLKPEREQPTLQSTSAFLAFVRMQDKLVQENGVWIVTTNPDAYSEPEQTLLEDIKALCRQEAIPLFIVRGSQLPNGWQRYDNAR